MKKNTREKTKNMSVTREILGTWKRREESISILWPKDTTKTSNIREEAICSQKYEWGYESIGEYRFRLLSTLLISGRCDIVVCCHNDKKECNRRSKVECKTEKFVPDSGNLSAKISSCDDSAPDFYESKKYEPKSSVDNTIFCHLLLLLISSRHDKSEESPREWDNRKSKNKNLEETHDTSENSFKIRRIYKNIYADIISSDISYSSSRALWYKKYLIDCSWNIQKEKSYQGIYNLFSLGLDTIFIIRKYDHIRPDKHEIYECKSRHNKFRSRKKLKSKSFRCFDRISLWYWDIYRGIFQYLIWSRWKYPCKNIKNTQIKKGKEKKDEYNVSSHRAIV